MSKTVRKPAAKSTRTNSKRTGTTKAKLAALDVPKTRHKPAKPAPAVESDGTKESALKAAQYALDKKAENVKLLDLREVTTMTDYFVIATGTSQPQVKAIAENVIREMRDTEGMPAWRSEGWEGLEWVLIDFVDFVVHVFQPEARQYYNVERLWGDAPTIDVEDNAKPKRKTKATKKDTDSSTTATRSAGVRVISDFKEVKR